MQAIHLPTSWTKGRVHVLLLATAQLRDTVNHTGASASSPAVDHNSERVFVINHRCSQPKATVFTIVAGVTVDVNVACERMLLMHALGLDKYQKREWILLDELTPDQVMMVTVTMMMFSLLFIRHKA